MKDCRTLILTKQEQKAFHKFKKSNSAELTGVEYRLLKAKGLVERQQIFNQIELTHIACISRYGRDFRAYQKDCRRQTLIHLIQYLVTTFIALAAVSLTFLSS